MALQDFYLLMQTGDGNIMQVQGKVTITIYPALSIDVSGVPVVGEVGVAYTGQVKGLGGLPPYTFSVDQLPQGLTLNPSTGAITGTPTTAVTAEAMTFTINDTL